MLALSDPEVELPTLNMNPEHLENISMSSQGAVIHVDENTIPGQDHQITFHLQTVEENNLEHFNNNWANQNLLDPVYLSTAEQKPSVHIVEQPASHKLRFRYQCEGRGAGALQGQFSTSEKKIFPKIQIQGYKGPAVVVVSCVTYDNDLPRAHPHNLVSPASVRIGGEYRSYLIDIY